MFLQGDSLLTVTDHGIYRLALSDIRNEETALTTINPDMRCWDAAFVGDSLAVLWSPAKNSGMRRVTMFSASGNEGSTIDADPATTWITEFGGKLRCFGREGDFGCFRSAANIGGELYFIRDGELRRSSETKPEDDSDEWILMADNGYGLSNLSGLWKLNGDEPEFLGELKGVTGVRDISCDDGTMYLAAGDGLYAVSLAGHIFPHKRKAKLIEGNSNENSDRVESILAMGDTLYVGTRHGLHALVPGSGETRKYGFPALWASFESPYITDITRGKDGSLLMQTLNFGVWRLPSADSENAVATSLSMPAAAPMNTEALHRPATTWGSIGRTIVLLVAGILLLLGVMVLILFFIQRRHRLAVSALNTSLSSERKQYQSQKEELLRSREELATRQHELETLRQQHEEALRDTRHKMSEPMKRVAECLKQTIAAMPPDCAVAARLEQYLKPIAAFADSSAEDAEMSDAATHSCRLLLRYVNESVAAAENLVENVPKQGVMQQPLEQYAAKIRSMGDVRAASLSVQLKWLSQAVGVLMEAENTILARISELCERDGDTSNQFYSEDLAELWNDIVVPAARKMSRCALAKDGLNKDTDLVTRRRTWIFTTITFYGCTAPEIDGRALTVDVRSLIRFENSARLGTIFNFWASQLSTTCMEYGPAGIPGSPADIMWKVWLSRQTVNLLGGNCSVTLPDGIRLAFARQHKLPIPPDLEARLGTRTIGRPKNS